MSNLLIPDPSRWQSKLSALQTAGLDQYCVIADWDRTLTRAIDEDGRDHSTYSVIVNGGYLGEDFGERSRNLFVTYRKVELSGEMASRAKAQQMYDWWAGQFQLLIEAGLSLEVIHSIGRDKQLLLRSGVRAFLTHLHERSVPLIILSASFSHMIESILRTHGLLFPNIRIIANRFCFGASGKADGFEEPILHSLNKQDVFHRVLKEEGSQLRPNAIILGDSVEDMGVADGLSLSNTVKIAWLHENARARQDEFAEAADALVLNDAGLETVWPLSLDRSEPDTKIPPARQVRGSK